MVLISFSASKRTLWPPRASAVPAAASDSAAHMNWHFWSRGRSSRGRVTLCSAFRFGSDDGTRP
eukprot:scaffold273_cov242-Pinguiococcus_pyrenoidosus.AAC.4